VTGALAAAAVAAYLVGAIPVGLLVGRVFGAGDIRRQGSGNIGATNVLRTAGRLPAVLTLAGDVVKGHVATLVGALVAGRDPTAAAVAAVAAVAGNCWPVYLRFRGGKGVATGLGALLGIVPLAVLPAAVIFVAVAGAFRYVSLGSLAGAVSVPVAAWLLGRYPEAAVLAAVAVAAIVVIRHRENIGRLRSGTERRLGQGTSA
jgi:glycerol-3-phosphate acyltransferase PlsY